ncbi:MAG: NAD(P)/FAD-dependent oxidoreductase [Chloroflexi bacterium]|nr:NAD(P)/FAD-dependent oxidoreductase [Chloroflexota bacterium]
MPTPRSDAYDVVVIGAGLAGMTAGALLAQNGMRVLVADHRPSPGGVCHSFQRDGFTFDVGPHLLSGCGDGWVVDKVLRRIGGREKVEFLSVDPLARVTFPELSFDLPARGEEFLETISQRFPSESRQLGMLYREMLAMYQEVDQLPHSFGIWQYLKVPVNQPIFMKYPSKTYQASMDDFLLDPRLKAAIASLWVYFGLPPSRISAVFWTIVMMTYFLGGGFYPKGGLAQLARAFAAGLENSGGELLLNSRAERIMVSRGRVEGVQFRDVSGQWLPGGMAAGPDAPAGETFVVKADHVVSAGDAVSTFLDMVGEEHLPGGFVKGLRRSEPSLSLVKVALGVEMDMVAAGFGRHDTVVYDSYDMDAVFARMRSGLPDAPCDVTIPSVTDPSLAPKGAHTVYLWNYAPYSATQDWQATGEKVAEQFIGWMDARAPGFARAVRQRLINTPQTFREYALTVDGAPYGWAFTPKQMGFNRLQPRTPIKGLYLAGHWTTPGAGVAGVVMSGERTADIVAAKEGFALWRKSA